MPRYYGSPPRVWGIRINRLYQLRPIRFTPTRVGNTMAQLKFLLLSSVHPHACGEYCWSLLSSSRRSGSPPRVWGIRDQPLNTHLQSGSPPRVWGIRQVQGSATVRQRFTPTRVGNTAKNPQWVAKDAVHPHACGEYAVPDRPAETHRGSPPRVWGIRGTEHQGTGHGRFTPTRVGNTLHRPSLYWPRRFTPTRVGNTPLASSDARLQRFTPTRVGNTSKTSLAAPGTSVHPHACGEYPRYHVNDVDAPGSPPRVWGIRISPAHRYRFVRFTPTRVGNTDIHRSAYWI